MNTNNTIRFDDGFSLEIVTDDSPESPREWDNLGTMVCFHRRYNLGDEHSYRKEGFSSWEQLKDQILSDHPGCIILPLYLMDHSSLTISTTDSVFRSVDPAGWDWGQVGFIFANPDGNHSDGQIVNWLCNEVRICNQFLQGNVYGFILRDNEGEIEDSCWGFYGSNPMDNGMLDYLHVKYRKQLLSS